MSQTDKATITVYIPPHSNSHKILQYYIYMQLPQL